MSEVSRYVKIERIQVTIEALLNFDRTRVRGRETETGREKKKTFARRISPESLLPPISPTRPASGNNTTYRATHIPGYWYAR